MKVFLSFRRAGCAVLLVLALGLAAPPVQAQAPPPADSSQVHRFRLADAYLRAGQFDQAIALLEDLYAAHPGTYAFYEKLKTAYASVKRYDEAVALVEERLRQERGPQLLAEKARLLHLKGDEEAAHRTWQGAIALAPEDPNTYRVVYQSLVDARLFEQAIEVLQQGRAALGTPEQFRMELAYLHSLTGRHAEAIQEYLSLLAEDDRRLGFVQRRLSRFMEQEGALKESIEAASLAVREDPLNRAYRELMAWLYMEDGQYRKAFDVQRAIDRLEDEQGRALFGFALKAADAGAYDVALDAYDEILQRHPQAPIAPEALRNLGMMHARWAETIGERAVGPDSKRRDAPHYEAALDAYRTYLKKYPNLPAYPDVLRRIGHLQQDVFFDLEAAQETLEDVVRRYPHTQAADEASYDLGRIAVLRGDLDEARLTFSRLAERLRIGSLAERARYELALLHFYQGQFDAAQTLAQAINENTSADVANDAIQLKVLILTGKGPDSTNAPLTRYATARLKQRQHRLDEAQALLDELLQDHARHPLADDARFLRAQLLRERGQTEDALAAFAEIPLMHPQSHLADRSLFEAAQIQEQMLDDKEAALQTYTRLLTEYPGSLLATDARARIRALRDG